MKGNFNAPYVPERLIHVLLDRYRHAERTVKVPYLPVGRAAGLAQQYDVIIPGYRNGVIR